MLQAIEHQYVISCSAVEAAMLLDDAVLQAESDVSELHAVLGDAVLLDDALLEVGIVCFETAFRMLEVTVLLGRCSAWS